MKKPSQRCIILCKLMETPCMADFARRTRSGVSAFLAAAAYLAFAASPTALGQNGAATAKQAPPQSDVPTIKVTARETVVDVTVTDKDGKPVPGLTRADFTVQEDGKSQAIRSFQEYDTAAPSAAKELPKLPPNIYTDLQPPPASSAVNILLLDFVNTSPGHTPGAAPLTLEQAFAVQHHVKQEAMKYLQTMTPGTRVAVIGMSWPGSLRLLQGVTSDPALLSAAVNSLDYVTDNARPLVIDMTIESLKQIAAVAAQIKGRKNLIWFTYGLALMTEEEVCIPINCPDWPKQYHKALSMLTDAQVTVYPVDARGLYVAGGYEKSEELLSLENIAEAGGGIAYYNSNDLTTGIANAIANGSDYYTLSYVPPGTQYDGRHHTIHLEADKPGLHLTYRDEYYAEDPSKMKPPVGLTLSTTAPEAPGGNMSAAMSRSMPTSEQILFNVKVEPSSEPAKSDDPPVMGTLDARFKDKPLTRYEFSYSISAGQLVYSNGPNGTHNGSVELDIAAYDADAKLVTGLSQTVTMSLNDTTVANKGPLNFSQQIDLPPGQLFLRIGILDTVSNKVGTMEIPLMVGKKPPVPVVADRGTPSK
jgi:VWFA-related protein